MPEHPFAVDGSDRAMVATHYYRAMVGRADIWRLRMDTTTNWAIGTTAGVLSLALGSEASPHAVILIAPLMTISFLALEARRLTFYHLWQARVLRLERALVEPALAGPRGDAVAAPGDPATVAALVDDLGRTIPTMSRWKAAARRLRRIYLYLLAFQLVAWGWKLSIHPTPADDLALLVARAAIGPVPGSVVALGVVTSMLAALALAVFLGGHSTAGGPSRVDDA